MYRNYENPYKLEQMLAEAKEELERYTEDEELAIYIHELEDRINFAWQDDEYDGYDY